MTTGLPSGRPFVLGESATQLRLDAEHSEEVGRDAAYGDLYGIAVSGEIEGVVGKRGHGLKRLRPIAQQLVAHERAVEILGLTFDLQADQLLGIAIRKRLEEQRICNCEDCGGGSNADGQNQNRSECKGEILTKKTQAKAKIAEERLHEESIEATSS